MNYLQNMHTFVQVARRLSFVRAARALNLPPPVVAARIAELENELRVQLLVRAARQLQLTADGERVYRRAAHLLRHVETEPSPLSGRES